MTFRSIFIGILGAILLGAVGYWADHAARLNRFVSGQFPIAIFGPMVLVVLVVNPLLRLVRTRWTLRRAELAVIVLAMLAACFIPGNGLLRYFTRVVVMPIHFRRVSPAWQQDRILEQMPPAMLANRGTYDPRVVDDFIEGQSSVPWTQWRQTLTFWVPTIVLFAVAAVAVALIVHPQWSRHERLRYPIAEFANTMLEPRDGREVHQRLAFRVAAVALLAFHVNNGLAQYLPAWSVVIPRDVDLSVLGAKFPSLTWGAGIYLQHPTIWPVAVALAFFLPKDVSFSVGISQPLATLLGAAVIHFGWTSMDGDLITGRPFDYQRAGGCLALAVVLVYFGRRFYAGILRRAVLFSGAVPPDAGFAVGACRVLLICIALLTVLLAWVAQLAWPLAIALIVLTLLAYLSVARITAEFGLFYAQIGWYPVTILLGLFGAMAVGPGAILVLAVLSMVFVAQPEESVMTFVVQGLKIGEAQRLPERRSGLTAMTVVVLGVAVAVPVALAVDYHTGNGLRSWEAAGLPRQPYEVGVRIQSDLRAAGDLHAARTARGWDRIKLVRPDERFVLFFGIGIVMVFVTYVLRIRFRWWPLHPILFLIWETWASAVFFTSFLAAWAIKVAVSSAGTRKTMETARVAMAGVLAGELAGGMLWMLVGAIYYFKTGSRPPYYNIFPF